MMATEKNAWDSALEIIAILRGEGHRALLAGGCVRDRLLGREPKDFDVATSATPTRVREIFPGGHDVGAKFGVTVVRLHGFDTEVATFRSDGGYSDGRRPDDVTFGTDREDALRRDFTINGMFHDPFGDLLLDFVGGRADLDAGVVRAIGDPDARFLEDHLRMLRAVRFASRLGFEIESGTMQAIQLLPHRLRDISAERVWMELGTILSDPSRVRGWALLAETGLRDHLCALWPAVASRDAAIAARLGALRDRPIPAALGLAAALADEDSGAVRRTCRRLKMKNDDAKATEWMVRSLPALHGDPLELADLKTLMAEPMWPELLSLFRGDLLAKGLPIDRHSRLSDRAGAIDEWAPAPFVTGDDLVAMGMDSGPPMGRLLRDIYRGQLNETVRTRRDAMAMARAIIG